MKRQFLPVLALAGCALFSAAHAASAPAAVKTRAQVQADLCRAEQAGLVPATNLGPPDAWTIERNKENFKLSHIQCGSAQSVAQAD